MGPKPGPTAPRNLAERGLPLTGHITRIHIRRPRKLMRHRITSLQLLLLGVYLGRFRWLSKEILGDLANVKPCCLSPGTKARPLGDRLALGSKSPARIKVRRIDPGSGEPC